jgi:hypothetical protein
MLGTSRNATKIEQEINDLSREIYLEIRDLRAYELRVGIFDDSGSGQYMLAETLFYPSALGHVYSWDDDDDDDDDEYIYFGDIRQHPFHGQLWHEGGGIIAIGSDLPNIDKNSSEYAKVKDFYKRLFSRLDLAILVANADSRQDSTSLDAYQEFFEPHIGQCPVGLVLVQAEKIEPVDDFFEGGRQISEQQEANLAIRALDVSKRFGITPQFTQAVSVDYRLNLQELASKIIDALPDAKKSAFVESAKDEFFTVEAFISAERGLWDCIMKKFPEFPIIIDHLSKNKPLRGYNSLLDLDKKISFANIFRLG